MCWMETETSSANIGFGLSDVGHICICGRWGTFQGYPGNLLEVVQEVRGHENARLKISCNGRPIDVPVNLRLHEVAICCYIKGTLPMGS